MTERASTRSLRRYLAAVPVDVWALFIIAIAMVLTHSTWMRRGMCWNEPSWLFHFAKRTVVDGAVPYRDYVFPDGPLPIYVEAAMQALFGGTYVVSLWTALLVETLRVFVVWLIVRRVAGVVPAALVAVFCALDPMFSYAHHWTTPYAQLFGTLAALCLLAAARANEDAAPRDRYFVLAGVCIGALVSARTDVALATAAMLLVATTVMTLRRHTLTTRQYAALWAGCAATYVLVGVVLAVQGAFGDAVEQTVFSMSDITGVGGAGAVIDALTGGSATADGQAWWAGLLLFLALPAIVVALTVAAANRTREVPLALVGLLVLPAGIVIAVSTRFAGLYLLSDVPRAFFTLTTALAVLWPERLRTWFGVEPLTAIALGGLPLASDWALETTFPGRGWGDASSLVIGAVLFSMATAHLARRTKVVIAGLLALAGVLHIAIARYEMINPVARPEAADGTLRETNRRSDDRILRGLKLSKVRLDALAWVRSTIPAGSTCFIYGNTPALYTLLRCDNPTRLDVTSIHFASPRAAAEAIEQLRRTPPDYLIVHESQWISPPYWQDLGGDIANYKGINRESQRIMHVGLREIANGTYEPVGVLREVLGDAVANRAAAQWDRVDMMAIYRRIGVEPARKAQVP